jgi:hypothetical protein
MRELTYRKCQTAYVQLVNKFNNLNDFKSLEDLVEAVEFSGSEVSGAGNGYYITRKSSSSPYGPDNVQLVEVVEDESFDDLNISEFLKHQWR